MEIYALDKNFDLVSIGIPYSNLQWNRKYYEAGDFSVEIPLKIYDTSWKYIGTKDRPELGMIQKIQEYGEGDVNVLLSGFFCEKMLDDKVIMPRYIATRSTTEQLVRELFSEFKKTLPIKLGKANNPLLGNKTECNILHDELGKKLYSMLETRECSYRVRYDFEDNELVFTVWQGVNRTQSQSANSYQVFSSEFGNIIDKSIDIDESGYKNYAIIPLSYMQPNGALMEFYVYLDNTNGEDRKEIVLDVSSSAREDADLVGDALQDARERMTSYAKVEDINVVIADNTGYLVDYDLGDKCDVVLNDVGLKMETRVIEIQEVIKPDGGHAVTIGLGNKRIDNIRRAVNSI